MSGPRGVGSGETDATVLEELVRDGGESAGSGGGYNTEVGMGGKREEDATGCAGVAMLSGETRLRGLYGDGASCTERYGG